MAPYFFLTGLSLLGIALLMCFVGIAAVDYEVFNRRWAVATMIVAGSAFPVLMAALWIAVLSRL